MNAGQVKFKSELLNTLSDRGYLHQITDASGLDDLLSNQQALTAYVGFDCTAKSLHIGSMVQIMVMRYLRKFGHKVIALLGSATTKIGDPSGRDRARKMLCEDEIASNKQGILKTIKQFLQSHDDLLVVDNSEWLDRMGYLDFLREVGSKFSVNAMLSLDSVSSRLNRSQNLSFLEFSYSLLQSYDFVELHRKYGCVLQVGGSDQWGNIVSGIELGRKLGLPKLYGLTTNLLLNSAGAKMGKTADGAIWLDASMYDPSNYWQYFRNIPDRDVGHLLRLLTELPLNEIKRLESLEGEEINEAKKILATEVTAICHGRKLALDAASSALRVFEDGDDAELPSFQLDRNLILGQGITLARLLHMSGLENSIGAGRRLISGRGCKVNDIVIDDVGHRLLIDDFERSGGYVKIFCGKKRRIKVVLK